jgi:UDP-N-acetylmuramate dehydrogenase
MTVTTTIDHVAATLVRAGLDVQRDVPLAPMTTFKVGGSAALVVTPRHLDQLVVVADALRGTDLPVLVVGRGSNLLVADEGFRGLAVSLVGCTEHIHIDVDHGSVLAGGAVFLPVLARRTAAAGLTGFEWAVGVPGSVGGAVRMNAGGHGSDIAASLVEVHRFDARTGAHAWVPAAALGLRFRASDLTDDDIVTEARLQLAPGDVAESEAEIDDVVRWRREHQPGGRNCGSVFVNPVPGEVSAGELVDQLGLRGMQIGGARISEKHANFIQAGEGATAADIRALIEQVRRVVADATGYELRSEVRMVGFDTETTP